jgi:hypothetical protein
MWTDPADCGEPNFVPVLDASATLGKRTDEARTRRSNKCVAYVSKVTNTALHSLVPCHLHETTRIV